MTTRRRLTLAGLVVAALVASDTLLALALLAAGISWWSWPVALAVAFHVGWLALAWWKFW